MSVDEKGVGPEVSRHRIVVIGAGFAGLQVVSDLKGAGAEITLIDRRNHHLFQPLLYQVATTILSPSEIAWPIRGLMEHRPDVTTLLAEVTGISENEVHLKAGAPIPFDTLVVATGSRPSYFGHPEWEAVAPGLKSLEDATKIRRKILLALERAERETDPEAQAAHLTFAVIGGGPTGVELAGIIAELVRKLRRQFRNVDLGAARILLVEGGKRILGGFDLELAGYATEALSKRGVEIRLGKPVTDCSADGLRVGEEFIPCRTILWAAGVAASPAARWLGIEGDRTGRVPVNRDLSPAGRPDVFVIGDTAAVSGPDGTTVPGIAPAAKQQGRHVARVIRARLRGAPTPAAFSYRHLGDLATIGERAAVIQYGQFKLRGRMAWWLWGLAHIYFLINTRSRATVAWNWFWSYVRGKNAVRLITHPPEAEEP